MIPVRSMGDTMGRVLAVAVLAVVAVVVGCGGRGAEDSTGREGPGSGSADDGANGGDGRVDSGGDRGGEQAMATYTNPVYPENFPDPHAIKVGDEFVVYATNSVVGNVPAMRSRDLVDWTVIGDTMPEIGAWARTGKTWAPEVLPLAEDRYVLYYTADSTEAGRQCVGRAVATRPEGPFVDESDRPLICQAAEGGSIDASPFRDDDGTLYLYWKNDGNAVGRDTWIWVQRLSPDGTALVGEPERLFRQDALWEGRVVEAPFMWRRDGRYYLFYSANAYDSDAYAVGYAECESPVGPCRKAAENPILSTRGTAAGPGHMCLVTRHGRTWMLYHAWMSDAIGSVMPGRPMWLDEVVWTDGRPVVRGPTDSAQPLP
jgi:beta-xylosidase